MPDGLLTTNGLVPCDERHSFAQLLHMFAHLLTPRAIWTSQWTASATTRPEGTCTAGLKNGRVWNNSFENPLLRSA